jgi:protein-S-isoprenylcysteine O-methyltransferase Ste14
MASGSATQPATSAPAAPGRRNGAYWIELAVGRALPAAIFSIFIAAKLEELDAALEARPFSFADAVIQGLGLVVFTLLVVLFVVRLPRRGGDRRIAVVLTSFFGSFAIMGTSALPQVAPRPAFVLTAAIVGTVGLAGTVWALVYLRRSFSILPEARRLVTSGPYAIVRHPLYLFEAMTGIAATLPTVSWPGLILIAIFVGAQLLRMRWEEEVLALHFGEEYRQYRRRVPKYLPWPRPR